MIEEGCDAGLIAGEVTDDAVVARPAGQIHRCLAAAPSLIESRPAVEKTGRSQDLAVAGAVQ
jgi:hypothetical protein